MQQSPDTATVVTDTLLQAVQSAPEPEVFKTSFFDLLVGGGWTMIPIGLLSILTLALFIERLRTLKKVKSNPEDITRNVSEYVHRGDLAGATAYCRAQDDPPARIIQRGLERVGRPISEIKEAVQEAGRREAFELEKRLDLLASSAAIAPMLGFLGTVLGMIEAFQDIQRYQGVVNPSLLAGGIWQALITTAAGLTVGIAALFAYNFLVNRISRMVNDLERASTDFIDLLQTPARPNTSG